MKIFLVFSLILCFASACKDKNVKKTETETTNNIVAAARDSLLITDSSWGVISKSDNVDSLKLRFGSNNIKDERICGAECADSIDVTFIYPGTAKALTIYWLDSGYHKIIASIETVDTASPYHTSTGIHIGSTLGDVEKINGKKVSFSGFGWDYGGFIGSFNDGLLTKSALGLQLDYIQHPGDEGLYGDRELNTEMPLVKKNLEKIVVTGITLSFPR